MSPMELFGQQTVSIGPCSEYAKPVCADPVTHVAKGERPLTVTIADTPADMIRGFQDVPVWRDGQKVGTEESPMWKELRRFRKIGFHAKYRGCQHRLSITGSDYTKVPLLTEYQLTRSGSSRNSSRPTPKSTSS